VLVQRQPFNVAIVKRSQVAVSAIYNQVATGRAPKQRMTVIGQKQTQQSTPKFLALIFETVLEACVVLLKPHCVRKKSYSKPLHFPRLEQQTSVVNLEVFPRNWVCFFSELRVIFKTSGLLVFGFAFANRLFSKFYGNLLFQYTVKCNLACVNLLILSLFIQIYLLFVFNLLACSLFQRNKFLACFSITLLILGLFLQIYLLVFAQ